MLEMKTDGFQPPSLRLTYVFTRFTYFLQGRRQEEKWESETSSSVMLGRSMKGNTAYIWIWRRGCLWINPYLFMMR